MRAGFRCGDPTERDHLEDLVIDGSILLKMKLQEVVCGGMGWIAVAPD